MELMVNTNQPVSNAESSFRENAEIAKQLGASILELSVRLQEMVDYKEQAMMSIQSVSAITEETAASAEQVSASAEQQQREMEQVASSSEKVNLIAGELKEVVKQFKV